MLHQAQAPPPCYCLGLQRCGSRQGPCEGPGWGSWSSCTQAHCSQKVRVCAQLAAGSCAAASSAADAAMTREQGQAMMTGDQASCLAAATLLLACVHDRGTTWCGLWRRSRHGPGQRAPLLAALLHRQRGQGCEDACVQGR